MSIDKRVFKKSDPFVHNDGIHSNCRGIWVEIMEIEKRSHQQMEYQKHFGIILKL